MSFLGFFPGSLIADSLAPQSAKFEALFRMDGPRMNV